PAGNSHLVGDLFANCRTCGLIDLQQQSSIEIKSLVPLPLFGEKEKQRPLFFVARCVFPTYRSVPRDLASFFDCYPANLFSSVCLLQIGKRWERFGGNEFVVKLSCYQEMRDDFLTGTFESFPLPSFEAT